MARLVSRLRAEPSRLFRLTRGASRAELGSLLNQATQLISTPRPLYFIYILNTRLSSPLIFLFALDMFQRRVGSRSNRGLFCMARARFVRSVRSGWPVPSCRTCCVGFFHVGSGIFGFGSVFWVRSAFWSKIMACT
jgi:hypothetical protein